MGTVYVFQPDVVVTLDGGVLRVRRTGPPGQREELLQRPIAQVSELVLFGQATVTPAAMYSLLEQGTGIHYLTRGGRHFAHIAPTENKNAPLRVQQYAAHLDTERKLSIARRVVQGKVQNSVTILKRRQADSSPITALGASIARCDSVEGLRGLEGVAARHYFSALGASFPPDFAFTERSRRPPRDRTNSLLSLAYTFLAKEAHTALRIAGLDPMVGYLHEVKYGRPALALDLMEEFRSILADSVVLTLLNREMLGPEHFDDSAGFPQLTEDGFKQFLRAWEDRLMQTVKHPLLGQKLDYRQILLAQARILGKHLMGELADYQSFTVR